MTTKHQEGEIAAQRDIASGIVRIFSGAPLRSEWGQYLIEILLKRFGVVVEFESDITSQDRTEFVVGYNAAVGRHVDSQFGHGSFAAAEAEVQGWREQRNREYLEAQRRLNQGFS
jgi:hypothetical protein